MLWDAELTEEGRGQASAPALRRIIASLGVDRLPALYAAANGWLALASNDCAIRVCRLSELKTCSPINLARTTPTAALAIGTWPASSEVCTLAVASQVGGHRVLHCAL